MRSIVRRALTALLLTLLALGPAVAATDQEKAQALVVARGLLSQRAPAMGLQAADLEGLIVTDSYTTKHNGVTHIYVRQSLRGIELANGNSTLNVDRDGKLLSIGNRLVPDLAARVNTNRPLLDREQAIRRAAQRLGLEVVEPLELLEDTGGPTQKGLYGPAGLSLDPIPIELAYHATPAGPVRLTWEMLIR